MGLSQQYLTQVKDVIAGDTVGVDFSKSIVKRLSVASESRRRSGAIS